MSYHLKRVATMPKQPLQPFLNLAKYYLRYLQKSYCLPPTEEP
jgi:hypothetical protein